LDSAIAKLLDKSIAGERLSNDEALRLLECHDLAALGRAADAVTRRLHPEDYRTYNIDRNINYTNVCTAVCDFCAFFRKPKDAEGYVLSREELLQKIQETVDLGGDQILMQGGLHPEFQIEWYEELLADIKSHFPQVNIHGFSPPEIHHFTKIQPTGNSSFHQDLEAAAEDCFRTSQGGRAWQPARRRRRDPGRPRAQGADARQGAYRRLVKRQSRVARDGRAQHGHDDVRTHRNPC
jgi:cyclic dehypoxanthinyl futalosine synthase